MGSVMMNFNYQFKKNGIINVFKGNNGYGNGEQVRDFIHVDDCIDVNMYFFKNNISGIFNVGTGKKNTFNKVARSIFKFHKEKNTKINYIDFPKNLIGKYQSYTKANIDKLRKNGYKKKFIDLEKGVFKYLKFLNKSQLKK
jgi:ADP-L-glycero-D-manno-heptose 6-epimerase